MASRPCRRVRRRPLRLLTFTLVTLIMLAGCDAEVRTTVTVRSLDVQELQVGVAFTGEAAAAATEPANQTEIINLFRAHLGVSPQVTSRNEAVTFSAPVSYDQLRRLSDLTGVAEATVTGDDDTVTVRFRFVDPVALRAALHDSTDEPGVPAAMEGATTVSVAVVFPGPVLNVGGDVPATIVGNEAVFSGTLEAFPEGVGTVTGSVDEASGRSGFPIEVAVTVAAAVLAGVAWWWTRRRSGT